MQNYSLPASFQRSMHLTSAQLQRLFDSLLSVVFAIDLDGYFVYVSKSASSISGYDQNELIGTAYNDLLAEEDKLTTQDYFRKQIYGQDQAELENHIIRRDGASIPVSWTVRWDAKDKMFYCVVSDISKRKATEQQKQQYHQEVLNILDRITDCFFSVDRDWTVTYRNQQTEILTGKLNKEILGKNLWVCYPMLVDTKLHEQFHKALTEQVSVQFEFYFNPVRAWLSMSAYPSESGLSVFFRNINERKQTELLQLSYDEELKDHNTHLKSILDSCNDGFIGLDEEQKVIHWNKRAEDIFGIKRYVAHRKNFRACFSGIDGIAFYQAFEHVNAKRKGGYFNIFFQQTNKWYETTVTPVYKGASIFIKDITSQLMPEEGQKKLLKQAGNEVQEQQQIIAPVIKAQEREGELISRELHNNVNQVLNTVKLYTELCLAGAGNKEDILRKSLSLLQSTIKEISSLSKRLSPPSLGNINLKDSIKELVESVTTANAISISLDTKRINNHKINHELHVAAYRILQEHLANIVNHACAQKVQVHINCSGNDLILKVTDDGVGFDTTQKSNGIGLTNMITRAEVLNGSLTINSMPGSGCELHVRLPLS